jgi:hypothetical protein
MADSTEPKNPFSVGFRFGCGMIGAIAACALVLLVLSAILDVGGKSKLDSTPAFEIGAICRLAAKPWIYAAEDWWIHEKWLRAASANDRQGLQELVNDGRVLLLDYVTPTTLRILEGPREQSDGSCCYKVRVLDGTHAGKALVVLSTDVVADSK